MSYDRAASDLVWASMSWPDAPGTNRQKLVLALAMLPPLYSTDGDWLAPYRVKLFLPDSAATWFLKECNPAEGLAFGLCDLGHGAPELGSVSVNELLDLSSGQFGLPVELDEWHDSSSTLSQCWESLPETSCPSWVYENERAAAREVTR